MQGVFRGWPEGVQAAVSLSFDDGVPTQLSTAIPILDRHGVKATFYVNPAPGARFEHKAAQWQQAVHKGYEIGNHTLTHPCSGNFPWVKTGTALEFRTLTDMESDVLGAEEALRRFLPGLPRHSFAYPCGLTDVGRGEQRQSYVPLIARHFSVARGLGESANDPRSCDVHCLSAWMMSNVTGRELIDRLEPALQLGHWAIFCFHGVDGDNLPVSSEALERLASYLAGRRPAVWVDTVQRIGEYVAGWQASLAEKQRIRPERQVQA